MAKVRVHNLTMSLDGCAADPDQGHDHPLGVDGERLHAWALATGTFGAMHGTDAAVSSPAAVHVRLART